MHKTRIRLYLCFNKPIRKKCVSYTKLELNKAIQKNKSVHALIQFTDKPMSWEASISIKHETGLSLKKQAQEFTATSRKYGAWSIDMCTGRIAEGTASCYMLLQPLESILFGPELLRSRFFFYFWLWLLLSREGNHYFCHSAHWLQVVHYWVLLSVIKW
jgi:hypothetical protein